MQAEVILNGAFLLRLQEPKSSSGQPAVAIVFLNTIDTNGSIQSPCLMIIPAVEHTVPEVTVPLNLGDELLFRISQESTDQAQKAFGLPEHLARPSSLWPTGLEVWRNGQCELVLEESDKAHSWRGSVGVILRRSAIDDVVVAEVVGSEKHEGTAEHEKVVALRLGDEVIVRMTGRRPVPV